MTTSSPAPSTGGRWLVGAAIVLLAVNLRIAVGSVGVVLDAIRGDLGMSVTTAGILTTLPVLCFSLFGVVSGGPIRRLGLHHTAALVLVLMAVGIAVRATVDDVGVFLVCSVVALAGGAVGNVILPPLVKVHFPDRIPLVSSLYGAALMAGATLSSVATVPLANGFGGWRAGTGAWALVALLALVPWLVMLRRDVHAGPTTDHRIAVRDVIGSPVVWALVLTFAMQSGGAYAQFGWFAAMVRDAGVSATSAGVALGIISAVGIPVTLLLPRLVAAAGDRPWLPIGFGLLSATGWAGVLLAPAAAPWFWALLLGIGGCAFTWALTMIARRARTAAGTATLSMLTQGIGYIIAGFGPFGAGALHEATGSWDASVIMLIGTSLLIAVFGSIVTRPVMLEDTLRRR